jgi:hypothetical protein
MSIKHEHDHELEHDIAAAESRRKQADAIAAAVAARSAHVVPHLDAVLRQDSKIPGLGTLLPLLDFHTSWQKEPGGAYVLQRLPVHVLLYTVHEGAGVGATSSAWFCTMQ